MEIKVNTPLYILGSARMQWVCFNKDSHTIGDLCNADLTYIHKWKNI